MQQGPSRSAYIRNRKLLRTLREHYLSGEIDKQQFLTLRGQVLSGDAQGAVIGLAKLTRGVKQE